MTEKQTRNQLILSSYLITIMVYIDKKLEKGNGKHIFWNIVASQWSGTSSV